MTQWHSMNYLEATQFLQCFLHERFAAIQVHLLELKFQNKYTN
jgi:hypothetical protein